MAVIKWQIAVLLTVAFARVLHPHAGAAAAVGWTLWSISQVRSPLLLTIQVGFAWGAFLLTDAYLKRRAEVRERDSEIQQKDSEIEGLRRELDTLTQASRDRIRSLPSGELAFLHGPQHRRALLRAVETAKNRLTILSGWVSVSVVDEQLLRALWDAIQRGVQVEVGYGFQGFSGETSTSRAAERAIAALEQLDAAAKSRDLQGGLRLHRFPNHEKIILIDSTTLICGSHNWLSNGRFDNSERSIVVKDRTVVAVESERIRNLFQVAN